ncbi:hypothetical protein BD779DRAFT_882422 [Infundibulicybe gibba]|nr:hypothetical protein BD779DRAFT_882422 [Infundibulicybe gibba]
MLGWAGRRTFPQLRFIYLFWCFPVVYTEYIPFLLPGFFFDYNIPGQPVPIPITEQCDRIHITWGRSGATGANPTAPYFLQVFTSVNVTPFVIPAGSGLSFDWDVPFAPGTLYQICMFDKNGITGGCQSMYTVVQNSTVSNPSCQNVTAPHALDVLGTVPGGPMSQYGFINQCTDVTVRPLSGKPPFILTVAPSLHPPFNITSNSMDPITWTVSLSWAFPFFLTMQSSDGLMWANGPMHSGGPGTNGCLAPGTISNIASRRIAAGAGVGSLIGGFLIGIAVAFLFLRQRKRKSTTALLARTKSASEFLLRRGPSVGSPPSQPSRVKGWMGNRRGFPAYPTRNASLSSVANATVNIPEPVAFLVHRDGGRVQSPETVELPPEYMKRPDRTLYAEL